VHRARPSDDDRIWHGVDNLTTAIPGGTRAVDAVTITFAIVQAIVQLADVAARLSSSRVSAEPDGSRTQEGDDDRSEKTGA
jgi:hypothetical protein